MLAPPNAENANAARARGGAAETTIKSKPDLLKANGLVAQYRTAPDALNASIALLRWAIDIREQLTFGLDLDDMKAEVAAFNRACEEHKARRRRLAS